MLTTYAARVTKMFTVYFSNISIIESGVNCYNNKKINVLADNPTFVVFITSIISSCHLIFISVFKTIPAVHLTDSVATLVCYS